MEKTQTFSSLKPEQKEAIGLLSIGTFLEYFDLMLYVHMAVLLNELFFPPAQPRIEALLAAFAFCSTYAFRPFGALLFGWIGDNFGRKATVIITTMLMSLCCLIMANLPTYAEVGLAASVIMLSCRALQGLSSMGEIVGAELYLIETTKPPAQYPVVMFIYIFSVLGGTAALGFCSLVTSYNFNWRIAFWGGAIIAIIGMVARTRLRETPDFADARRRVKKSVEVTGIKVNDESLLNEKVNKAPFIALFLIDCAWPVCFYFAYVYCSGILKNSFGYSAEEVIHHNFIVSSVQFLSMIIIAYMSYRVYPLLIVKFKFIILFIITIFCPYLLNLASSPKDILFLQIITIALCAGAPGYPIYLKRLPVFKRFTYSSLSYAISRAIMHIITSFGMWHLVEKFDHIGLLFITIPVSIGCLIGVHYFERLEILSDKHPYKKRENINWFMNLRSLNANA